MVQHVVSKHPWPLAFIKFLGGLSDGMYAFSQFDSFCILCVEMSCSNFSFFGFIKFAPSFLLDQSIHDRNTNYYSKQDANEMKLPVAVILDQRCQVRYFGGLNRSLGNLPLGYWCRTGTTTRWRRLSRPEKSYEDFNLAQDFRPWPFDHPRQANRTWFLDF